MLKSLASLERRCCKPWYFLYRQDSTYLDQSFWTKLFIQQSLPLNRLSKDTSSIRSPLSLAHHLIPFYLLRILPNTIILYSNAGPIATLHAELTAIFFITIIKIAAVGYAHGTPASSSALPFLLRQCKKKEKKKKEKPDSELDKRE